MRKAFLVLLVLVGCSSSSNNNTVDAAPPPTDSTTSALSCTNYCNTITTACTGANAQYGGANAADALAHCTGSCATFNTSAAQAGPTLGCHVNQTTAAMTDPTKCITAGPGGDQVGNPGVCGDACTNFCTISLGACGLKSATNTNGQYASMADCMTACGNFDKTVKYLVNNTTFPSATPSGDNLACRLYHATNAAVSAAQAVIHCPHTAADDPAKPNAACHN